MLGQLPFPTLDALPLGAHRLSGLHILTDEALFGAVGVRIAFAGRLGGTSQGPFASLNCGLHVGDDPTAVRRNRALLLEALGAQGASVIVPTQVHGTRVLEVDDAIAPEDAQADALEGADGLAVSARGVAAMLNFADCLPLIVASPSGAFCVAHAGWRGAVSHIAREAVEALSALDGCAPSHFNAYIGPHIRGECFEVGDEVARRFVDAFGPGVLAGGRVAGGAGTAVGGAGTAAGRAGSAGAAYSAADGAAVGGAGTVAGRAGTAVGGAGTVAGTADAATSRAGSAGAAYSAADGADGPFPRSTETAIAENPHVSLAFAVTADLVAAGVDPARIADARACTVCSQDRYFSYRASGGTCGRHAAVAVRMA